MNNRTKYNNGFSPFSVLLVFFAFMLLGMAFIPRLNIQLSPSRSLPSLQVTYYWTDASARNIEQEVSSKLEAVLSSIKGIKEISSESYKGSGIIYLSLKKNTNIDLARFEVATIIRRVYNKFPHDVSYPSISSSSSNSENKILLSYSISANESPFYIQKYVNGNIATKLAAIDKVDNIEVYGASDYEWSIVVNSELISSLDISIDNISQAIYNYFREEILGKVEVDIDLNKTQELSVKIRTGKSDSLQWSHIPIQKVENRIVYLTDIAIVKYCEKSPDSYYRINGLNTINMVVFAAKGTNFINLAEQVKDEIYSLRQTIPDGYNIDLIYDTTEYIQKELRRTGLRSVFSALILLLFIILITRQLKYLILIVLSLLINLVVAVIFYYLLKLEIHLYSLAGITVSFGIIIDNSIVMIDHYRFQKNRKVFLAVLAATLTTIGALSIIFLLEESQRINLIDFVLVMTVNLFVSLFIALFFIPAFIQKFPFKQKYNKIFYRRKRWIIRFNSIYAKEILFSKRFKWIFIFILILGFGIPVNWLPDNIEKETTMANIYNKTLGSRYVNDARPVLEKIFGGALRLFSENVFESSFYAEPERTKLYVRAKMPEGCTVQQLNKAVIKMENFLTRFDEIEMFETSIRDYKNAQIIIYFIPEKEFSSFPYILKGKIISEAINLGGMDWNVYGVGRGFSNELNSGYKWSQIILTGYNYNVLYDLAEKLSLKLSKNARVRDIEIAGNISWGGTSLHEYYLKLNTEILAMNSFSLNEFYSGLSSSAYRTYLSPVFYSNTLTPLFIRSNKTKLFNSWWLKNDPVSIGGKTVKTPMLGYMEKRKTGNDIYKFNQEYRLIVAWDFIGSQKLGERVIDNNIEQVNKILPVGYKAHKRDNNFTWDKEDNKQYGLILIVILIIYFICSILLESFFQPLAIIGLIPISYIGVFLTFYLFDINFDQGGYASFIMLSGLSVNAGLYIINDYNNFRGTKNISKLKIFLKAYNHKIVPIMLTIISTLLGLIPFVWGGQNEVFWYAFAAGSIGGMLLSFIAIIIYFPLFLNLKD